MTTPEQRKRPLLARIISLEGAMAAFALYSLVTGLRDGEEIQIFWGVMILVGLGILIAVRRRDWKKHWEEMEAIAAARTRAKSAEQQNQPGREE
jgi:hypothetical protein